MTSRHALFLLACLCFRQWCSASVLPGSVPHSLTHSLTHHHPTRASITGVIGQAIAFRDGDLRSKDGKNRGTTRLNCMDHHGVMAVYVWAVWTYVRARRCRLWPSQMDGRVRRVVSVLQLLASSGFGWLRVVPAAAMHAGSICGSLSIASGRRVNCRPDGSCSFQSRLKSRSSSCSHGCMACPYS